MRVIHSSSLVGLLTLTKASAWSSISSSSGFCGKCRIGFGRCLPSSAWFPLAALHSFSVDQEGEAGTESFRLFFKGKVTLDCFHFFFRKQIENCCLFRLSLIVDTAIIIMIMINIIGWVFID
jgi:hypothetical protein